MPVKRVNADKPHRWKADIAASVDLFNDWFMRFAPDAFRSTRIETTERVLAALRATNDLLAIDVQSLIASPAALPTLRMCTMPPLAVDRLIGLAGVSKSLIGRMEQGGLPARMKPEVRARDLTKSARFSPGCWTTTSSLG